MPFAAALSLVVAAQTTPATKGWFSHIEALAADGMEGRDTGSLGHRRAADYVASMPNTQCGVGVN